jgi:signal transduction histidine kinase
MSTAAELTWTPQDSKTEMCPLFEYAPLGLAQCQLQGNITALNPALEQMLGGRSSIPPSLCFADLIHPQDRPEGERFFRELFERQRDSFQIDSRITSQMTSEVTKMTGANSRPLRWTAWRVPGTNGEPDYALVLAEDAPRDDHEAAERLRQAEKLEAVGRLAGGVAHDFNNLLTGVLLYCDLLMAHLEPNHRVRKYAEEIRKAGMQATGLVRQLLAVARPTNSEPRLLSLNEVAEGMRNLLVRLIGENIDLQFHLDPNLGLVKMDPTQSQQILLNLVLNARDAMPGGGQINVETSNCKVQVLTEPGVTEPGVTEPGVTEPGVAASSLTSLSCALFVVADNGSGMDAATREHLFEAFFTTKAGKGTGLGLATVHDIVTSNGGLIHVESAPACGTRISVLLPLVPETVLDSHDAHDLPPEKNPQALIPKG